MAVVTMVKVAALLLKEPMSASEIACLLYNSKAPNKNQIQNVHRVVFRLRHDKEAEIECSYKTGKYTMKEFELKKHVRYKPLSSLIIELLEVQPLSTDSLIKLIYKVEPSQSRRASISKLVSRIRNERKINIIYDRYTCKYILKGHTIHG